MKSIAQFLLLIASCVVGAWPSNVTAQEPSAPPHPLAQEMEEMHHHHGDIPVVAPEFPRLGREQENPSAKLVQLEELEKMAMEKNPTLTQANAEIAAAKARERQAGLYPNPKVGYAGDEIRGGSFRGGEQGFFVSQPVITGGKLTLNRKIVAQDVRFAQMESREQELRVTNAVRIAYYRVLSAQEMLGSKKDLARIAGETVKIARQLRNTGQADESEVLQAEVEEQKLRMDVRLEENILRQEWRTLSAVVGNPDLEMATVAGYLDRDLPELDEDQAMQVVLRDSPSVAIALAGVDRAKDVLARGRREYIPDLEFRAGLSEDRELLNVATGRPVGLIGFAEVGVQLHIFNRNQGNIAAAQNDIQRARAETRRVDLALRERLASVFGSYQASRIIVEEYRNQLLPRAQKAYELLLEKYGLMTASYPQVLRVQQTLFQLQDGYISALEGLWVNAITLQGLLLTDGLEPPARPGEIDLPVREINVPMTPSAIPGGRQP
jgi:cobalt-zinc-cadmium efflux system outer membrane protein